MAKKLVLIDGHSILNRAFYGLPDLTNAQGQHTGGVYGFLTIMFKILSEENADYLAVAFDVHAPTFRHEIYADYKGTRKPMPEELREQVPLIKQVLRAMGILTIEKPGLEADDILGTLAKRAERDGMEVSLISGDRDFLQIASGHIKIRIPKTKGGRTEVEDYYAKDVEAAYQVTPLQFIELKALMGDTADNIPGVPKVGEKTAKDLMVTYGSLENIYEHLEEISKKSIRESLAANRELADLSLKLATINTDGEFPFAYEDAAIGDFYTDEAYELFQKLAFKNLLDRFDKDKGKQEIVWQELKKEKELEKFLKKAEDKKQVSLLFYNTEKKGLQENEQLSFFSKEEPTERLLCAAFSVPDEDAAFVDCENIPSAFLWEKVEALCKKGVSLTGFQIKDYYAYLGEETGTGQLFDVLIAAYLLNPLKSDYQIEDVAGEYLGKSFASYGQLFGKKKPSEALDEQREDFVRYLCGIVTVLSESRPILEKKLKETKQFYLFEEVEMPLSRVLYHMETEGVLVKPQELKEYGDALSGRIKELEESIWQKADTQFNINSPKQLGEVLFETMKLPGGKKTKTGYSTAADVLEKLAPEHPIVSEILEYRTLAKLKSTYADGLAAFIGEDKRIHTTFNQTITATGRLSSTEPNLQNIPMRMELGRRIRKVFVPKEGFVLMDADYSQIELRVLASMSGDEQLIDAYRQEADIHRITASKVFHVKQEDVTPLQRRNAKAVNFGIVYGISSFGLSQDLSISKKEAAEYIEKYFETYPGIKTFLDTCVKDAKESGYSVTMFGRRRPIPELSSGNFMQRSFGERVAMNAPIQGTAADIIKIAMVRVDERLRKEGFRSRLILQVHDELLIETAAEEIEQVREILSTEMRQAAKLAVELEIDLSTGDNWYDAH
ncbi:MAG: DNA polymerase I [Lachnospiraceae bacterium]|nr:DNA polymerase I [Lachnospiraceae bacterium]